MFYFLVYLMYFLFGSDVVALFFFLHFVFLYLAVVVGGGVTMLWGNATRLKVGSRVSDDCS